MTPQEAKKHRRQLHREIVRELRAKDRIKLHQFDYQIRACRAQRAIAIHTARKVCREAIAELRKRKREMRAELRNIERAGNPTRLRSTSRERAQESDDAVRRDLPSELVPVFDSVRGRIKGTARQSRTEAFLHWAHENPGEIVAIQQKDADRYLAGLIREQKQHKGAMRKASRYKISPAELDQRLADVPF